MIAGKWMPLRWVEKGATCKKKFDDWEIYLDRLLITCARVAVAVAARVWLHHLWRTQFITLELEYITGNSYLFPTWSQSPTSLVRLRYALLMLLLLYTSSAVARLEETYKLTLT